MNVMLKLTVLMILGALFGVALGIYLFENYWSSPFTIAISGTTSMFLLFLYGVCKWVE